MALFFDVAYALVISLALGVAGLIPGTLLGVVAPRRDHRLVLPGIAFAIAGWIWLGWFGGRYGISRLGLVLFAAVGAAGFVRGWAYGIDAGHYLRRRSGDERPLRAGGRARARR
jgi:hypothetical protein